MSHTLTRSFTKKWLLILKEYELIKAKNSKQFKTVKALCEAFQIQRRDIRRYYERWVAADRDPKALLPKKAGRRAGEYKRLSKEDERLVMKIRRRFEASGHEIHHLIKGQFDDIPPSVSTIYRTFKRYPLNDKRKKAIKRYEKQYPGELIHSDTYALDPTLVVGRKKYYLAGFIDDCTRLSYVEFIERQTAAKVSEVFTRSYKWFDQHGFKVDSLMTDNGSEFTGRTTRSKQTHGFEVALQLFHVNHIRTRPYRPQTNGKIERFWRILQDECLAKQEKTLTVKELKEEIKRFLYYYNYQRRHGALEYQTPLDKLKNIADLLPNL